MEQLATLLSDQAQIPLQLNAVGELSDPDVSIRSSLDKVIGDALLGEAREKLAQLEVNLRSQLDASLQQQLGGQPELSAALDQQDTEVTSIQNSIEEMLNAKISSVTSGAKDRIKDTLLKRRQAE